MSRGTVGPNAGRTSLRRGCTCLASQALATWHVRDSKTEAEQMGFNEERVVALHGGNRLRFAVPRGPCGFFKAP